MKTVKEIVTITEVTKFTVFYSGGFFDACSIEGFPTTPKVGQRWELTLVSNVSVEPPKLVEDINSQ